MVDACGREDKLQEACTERTAVARGRTGRGDCKGDCYEKIV